MRARLCVGHDAARCLDHSARPYPVRAHHHGGEPRPRHVVPPPVSRRRVAALRPGHPERRRRARLCAGDDLRGGWDIGSVCRAGGVGARAAISSLPYSYLARKVFLSLARVLWVPTGDICRGKMSTALLYWPRPFPDLFFCETRWKNICAMI